MLYLWQLPEYLANKHIAVYEHLSPDRFFFLKGIKLNTEEVSRCYCYLRSLTLDMVDDPLIRMQLRRNYQRAYIFTPYELFYFAGSFANKVAISTDDLNKLKAALSLTENDIDKPPKILTDKQLEVFAAIKNCPKFSRIPVMHISVPKAAIVGFDNIPNNANVPLVNQKIIDILLKLAPNDVQFFDTDIHCKDGILTDYKLLNITHTIKGIDHERSVYTKMKTTDAILGFKYLTYKSGCMEKYKLARDEEYFSNLLVTEEIRQAFEQAKIKGMRFITPEEFYC